MSATPQPTGGSLRRNTVEDIGKLYADGTRIAMLTAYDYPTARLLDEAGIPMLLVGDSLGQVILGYETTVRVTMAEMVHHTKAVVRGMAKRGAYVYWPRSGLVERLSFRGGRTIVARPLGQKVEHVLRGKLLYCREVEGEEKERLKAAMIEKRMSAPVAPTESR